MRHPYVWRIAGVRRVVYRGMGFVRGKRGGNQSAESGPKELPRVDMLVNLFLREV